MKDKLLDPRDIAYVLDHAALAAFLRAGNEREAAVTISAELAHVIAAHLRRAPLRRRRPPLSMRELGWKNALVRKARRYKAELKAAGKSATEAEHEAAEWFADGSHWQVETMRRAMQNDTDNK